MARHNANLTAICETIALLAREIQAAMRADDVDAFCRIVAQRGPLVAICQDAWDDLSASERQSQEPLLHTTLALDAATLELAEAWLREARRQLSHLGMGAAALRQYQAPLAQLPLRRACEARG